MKVKGLDNSHIFHIGVITVDSNGMFTPWGHGEEAKGGDGTFSVLLAHGQ